MFGQQNRLGTHLMRMSGKGKSEDNEKSMVLMSLLWKRGTRMEFSGHAHGQTQSLGHSGIQGNQVKEKDRMVTGRHLQVTPDPYQLGDLGKVVLILYDSVIPFKSKDHSSTSPSCTGQV